MPGDAAGAAAQADQHPARAAPAAAAASAARPTKSPGLSSLTTRPRPASNGVDVRAELVAVQRHARLQPERVPGGQPRGHQARRGPRLGQRRPDVLRVRGLVNSSNPSSPVYPVRASRMSRPATVARWLV